MIRILLAETIDNTHNTNKTYNTYDANTTETVIGTSFVRVVGSGGVANHSNHHTYTYFVFLDCSRRWLNSLSQMATSMHECSPTISGYISAYDLYAILH